MVIFAPSDINQPPWSGVEILQLLKDSGADLTKKNREGLMAADIMIAKHDVVFDGPRG